MVKTTISGDRVQAKSGKLCAYRVEIEHGAGEATYVPSVLLKNGKWFAFPGGTVEGATFPERNVAINAMLDALVEGIDLDALNAQHGS